MATPVSNKGFAFTETQTAGIQQIIAAYLGLNNPDVLDIVNLDLPTTNTPLRLAILGLQSKLTAGSGIAIAGGVISATSGGGSGVVDGGNATGSSIGTIDGGGA